MEQSPKTSFIPKQGVGGAPMRQRKHFNVLAFLAVVVFLATIALSAGAYFYEKHLANEFRAKEAEFAKLRERFSQDDVNRLRSFERKVSAATELLQGHLSVTKIFDILEMRTQNNTQFTSFAFARQESGNAEITLSGVTDSFNTAILQKRVFRDTKQFEDGSVTFSNLSVSVSEENERTVTFDVAAFLNTSEVLYTILATTTPATTSTSTLGTSTTTGVGAVSTTTIPAPAPVPVIVGTSTAATSTR